MTLPEQSDRAVAQTREFLVRLASPYGEGAIKGIRKEIRAEASRLLRHYPYAKTDEKRCVSDMAGASDIVTRLRNWREVHLARLHLLMDEAAHEMERLRADWPEQLAAARSEVERLRGYRDAAESDAAIANLVIDRLRNGALDGRETVALSGSGDCPASDNQMTPLQNDELAALTGDRSAVIRVVSALREYRQLVKAMCERNEMHNVRAGADDVPRIEGTRGAE